MGAFLPTTVSGLIFFYFVYQCVSLHRLQYFARGSQTYHAQLAVALKGKSALELKDEQVTVHR